MKVLPHITDRDLQRTQEQITALQRADLELLNVYSAAFLEQATEAASQAGAPVVIMCNVETEQVQPSPLDWDGDENALRLDPAIYRAAKRALETSTPGEQVVALLYHPASDVLSIYTVTPEP